MRAALGSGLAWYVAAAAFVVAMEWLGRNSHGDGADLLATFGLLLLGGVLSALELQTPGIWMLGLKGFVERRKQALRDRFSVKVGVDLRGTPPLPTRAVPHHRVLVPVLAVWTALGLAGAFLPFSLRQSLTSVAYLPWFVLILTLWALMLGAAAVLAFAAAAWLHDRFVIRPSGRARPNRRFEVLCITVALIVIAVPGLLLPTWWALVGALVAFLGLVGTLCWTRCFDLQLAWRFPEGKTVYASSWHATLLKELSFVLLVWLALVLTGDGRHLLGQTSDPATFITGALGSALAWIGGVVLSAVFVISSVWLVRHRRGDPSLQVPTHVHLDGDAEVCERAAKELRRAGFLVRHGAEAERDDVRLEIVPEPMPLLDSSQPAWPKRVSPTALRAPELIAIIARRDQHQRRRRLVRGIESAFKAASRRTYVRGTGFWVAPHWWFVPAMTRDTSDDEWDADEDPLLSDSVAPPWRDILGHAPRAHAHEMLRALHVDFILVEDGVGFRGFRRVLRVLFERFDIQGRPIESRHLQGIQGLRCLVHEFTCGDPWKNDDYPEPDYDDISRARILHVFRDRGGEEALDELSPDRIGLPDLAPVGMF